MNRIKATVQVTAKVGRADEVADLAESIDIEIGEVVAGDRGGRT